MPVVSSGEFVILTTSVGVVRNSVGRWLVARKGAQ